MGNLRQPKPRSITPYSQSTMNSSATSPNNAVVSWTGGKDGCLSCYKAMNDGYNIAHLLHFTNLNRTGSHELNPALIRAQALAIGLPLLQRDFYSYETEFKKAVRELQSRGGKIDAAVFGHIQTHRPLVERICRDLEIDLLLPLWKRSSGEIISEIIKAGFEVIVVSVKEGLLGREWLGRRIDGQFLKDLEKASGPIDPCGENGEFHSFVCNGPIFKKKIVVSAGDPVCREGYWFLKIRDFSLQEK